MATLPSSCTYITWPVVCTHLIRLFSLVQAMSLPASIVLPSTPEGETVRRFALAQTDVTYWDKDATPLLSDNMVFNGLLFKMAGLDNIRPLFADFVANKIRGIRSAFVMGRTSLAPLLILRRISHYRQTLSRHDTAVIDRDCLHVHARGPLRPSRENGLLPCSVEPCTTYSTYMLGPVVCSIACGGLFWSHPNCCTSNFLHANKVAVQPHRTVQQTFAGQAPQQ